VVVRAWTLSSCVILAQRRLRRFVGLLGSRLSTDNEQASSLPRSNFAPQDRAAHDKAEQHTDLPQSKSRRCEFRAATATACWVKSIYLSRRSRVSRLIESPPLAHAHDLNMNNAHTKHIQLTSIRPPIHHDTGRGVLDGMQWAASPHQAAAAVW
jgi:hypothetical protein